MTDSFAKLPLKPAMLKNLQQLGYQNMTEIQAQSLPHVLAGKDIIAKAKTGSGKTAAFGLGLLNKLDVSCFRPQAMVLCPTRELADQVAKELRRLARFTSNIKVLTLCGGVGLGPQLGSLQHGAHIVVGTPGRIQEHLRKGSLKLDHLKTLVLDEADRMLDMGFYDRIAEIIDFAPKRRQTLLFSATYPTNIKKLSSSIQIDPIQISVESQHAEAVIEQCFYEVNRNQRAHVLAALLAHYRPHSTVVFCNTKQTCRDVAADLIKQNISALEIHGDLEQRDRDQVLIRFANNSCSVLVATDVAARGLDIKNLAAVINYDLPRDPEVYTHRIGRTGRAGSKGLALSIFTNSEQYRVNAIEEFQGKPAICDVPESLDRIQGFEMIPPMVTLQVDGGRKQKVRPGDILGALTKEMGIPGDKVGKIDIMEFSSYIAIDSDYAREAQGQLTEGKIKGRNFRVRKLR